MGSRCEAKGLTRRDVLKSGAALSSVSAVGASFMAGTASAQTSVVRDLSGSTAQIDAYMGAPVELAEALDADPELAEAFQDLTPGRQKSYAINLNAAKKPETRVARIVKFRDKIFAGKGATER